MIRVRFAPSPTGHLHIGGARTALFNFLFARRNRGTFILRIEDTDEVRSTPESVGGILEGLRWLELDWDEGPEIEADGSGVKLTGRENGDFGPYFQMERQDLYRKIATQLLSEGKIYRCYCTAEDLESMRRHAQLSRIPFKYDGRCRELSEDAMRGKAASGEPHVLRFRMPQEGATQFKDLIHGDLSFENNLLDDFIIVKSSGIPTYNFACVVDDHFMKISHIIRGDDHLSNTPRQVRLFLSLGWEVPIFAHLSMILGPDGSRLSKRHGATSVEEYKSLGYLPEAMRNYLALLGWSTSDSQQIFAPGELAQKFDLEHCQKNPAAFDAQKLLWMNVTYIRGLADPELLERSLPWLEGAGFWNSKTAPPKERLRAIMRLEKEKYRLLSDIPKLLDFFFQEPKFDPQAVEKVLNAENASQVLTDMLAELGKLDPFTAKSIEENARRYAADKKIKNGAVFHPLRVAVSGRTQGPSLFEMIEMLGQTVVLGRIRSALQLPR
ncbi:MAG: glutamate--tRNA ligase [Elusimicrobia bacterium RIFCSPLOWO2_12_FULL_59_9]|nr:MAG: glutamate--tRNA ligase [Elusimicrobia bacterium RIFCSPLOWO2_12_FULL_59_9]